MRAVLLLGLALLVTGQVRSEVESAAETEVLNFVLNHADTSEETGGEGFDYKADVMINFNLFLGGDVEDEFSKKLPEEHNEDKSQSDITQVYVAHENLNDRCGCKKSVLEDTVLKFYYFVFVCSKIKSLDEFIFSGGDDQYSRENKL